MAENIVGLDFSRKVILAPMVRAGTLPMRLLALDYGADIVYCEEIIDHKMLKCRRVVNSVLGTVDFIDDTGDSLVFRTCARETDRLVFQIGTSDAQRALKVAQSVEKDVAAIDVNMGCPKEFSIKGGMGAALLSKPDKIKDILTTLVKGVRKPITCKIRILPDLNDTIALCELIQSTGVAALTIHGRTKDERPKHDNHNDIIRKVSERLTIPVIANGGSSEISCYEDVKRFRDNTGAASVMIARSAQCNCSIFRKEGKLPLDDVIVSYLKYAVDFENHPLNTKYCVQQMLQDLQDTPKGKSLLAATELREICKLWDLLEYYDARRKEMTVMIAQKRDFLEDDVITNGDVIVKKRKIDSDHQVTEVTLRYVRKHFADSNLPKPMLLNWATKNGRTKPFYETENREKLFRSTVLFDGRRFTTTNWEKNRKSSEQAAALAALYALEITIPKSETITNEDKER